jgi:hypothetical protein
MLSMKCNSFKGFGFPDTSQENGKERKPPNK